MRWWLVLVVFIAVAVGLVGTMLGVSALRQASRHRAQRDRFESYLDQMGSAWRPLQLTMSVNAPPQHTETQLQASRRYRRIAAAIHLAASRLRGVTSPQDLRAWHVELCRLLDREDHAFSEGAQALGDLHALQVDLANIARGKDTFSVKVARAFNFSGDQNPRVAARTEDLQQVRDEQTRYKNASGEVQAMVPEFVMMNSVLQTEADRLGASIPSWMSIAPAQ